MTHEHTRRERMEMVLEKVAKEVEVRFEILVAKISVETGASETKVQEYVRVLVQAGYLKNQSGLITLAAREMEANDSA